MPGYLLGRLLGLPAYKERTSALVVTAQETLYKTILVLLTVTAIVWMAIFLYATFYYSYMPAISHSRPIHFQYRACGRDKGICNFPSANVTLTRNQNLLMIGQPYKIIIELEMPESVGNQNVGMFMVCSVLKDKEGILLDKSCRSAMLHYKSPLHHLIVTLLFSPFLMSGSLEEKQVVTVELFSNFEEDPRRPVTEAFVEIENQHVDIYGAHLKIHAHFSGLRYIMFHWPILSACIGIVTNLFFLTIIAFLSWYKFCTPKEIIYHAGYDLNKARDIEERRAQAKQKLIRDRTKLLQAQSERNKSDGSSRTEVVPAIKEDLEKKSTDDAKEKIDGENEEKFESSSEFELVEKDNKSGNSSSDEVKTEPKEEERNNDKENDGLRKRTPLVPIQSHPQ